MHEDIYCRLPALGLRANDALTSRLQILQPDRNELPVKVSVVWTGFDRIVLVKVIRQMHTPLVRSSTNR